MSLQTEHGITLVQLIQTNSNSLHNSPCNVMEHYKVCMYSISMYTPNTTNVQLQMEIFSLTHLCEESRL